MFAKRTLSRSRLSIAFMLALALGSVACAGRNANTPPGTTAGDYRACPRPDWADNPSCEGGLCAVGIGKSMDYGFAREKAEADGRAKLAQMLESEVSRLFEQLKLENREFTDAAASAGFDVARSVNRQLTSTTLTGSRPVSYYNDCVRGYEYALMVLDFELLQSSLKGAMKEAAGQIQNLRQDQLNSALSDMDGLLEKRRAQRFAQDATSMGK